MLKYKIAFALSACCLVVCACGGGGGGSGPDGAAAEADGDPVLALDLAGRPRRAPTSTMGALEALL